MNDLSINNNKNNKKISEHRAQEKLRPETGTVGNPFNIVGANTIQRIERYELFKPGFTNC